MKEKLSSTEKEVLELLSPEYEYVNVCIGYEWIKERKDGKQQKDEHYENFLQPLLNKYTKSFNDNYERFKIKCSVNKLRGSHAGINFLDIYEKIKNADVLVFDITSHGKETTFNYNVMLELGIALGMGKTPFVFVSDKLKDEKLPSDLNGFFLTYYSSDNSKFALDRIKDKMGFVNKYVSLIRKAGKAKISNKLNNGELK